MRGQNVAFFPDKKAEDPDTKNSVVFERANPKNQKIVEEIGAAFWASDPAIAHLPAGVKPATTSGGTCRWRGPLAARGESTIGRVLGAAGADARRRDAGDAGTSSRSANAADAPVPPEPFGRIGIAGNLYVARRQRCPRIASSSRLDLARNTYARGLLYFHHGLLGFRTNIHPG